MRLYWISKGLEIKGWFGFVRKFGGRPGIGKVSYLLKMNTKMKNHNKYIVVAYLSSNILLLRLSDNCCVHTFHWGFRTASRNIALVPHKLSERVFMRIGCLCYPVVELWSLLWCGWIYFEEWFWFRVETVHSFVTFILSTRVSAWFWSSVGSFQPIPALCHLALDGRVILTWSASEGDTKL